MKDVSINVLGKSGAALVKILNTDFSKAGLTSEDQARRETERAHTIDLIDRIAALAKFVRMNRRTISVQESLAAHAQEEIDSINEILIQYPRVIQLAVADEHGLQFVALAPDLWAAGAIDTVVRLAESNQLARIRRCATCSAWFFAKKLKSVHHSTNCYRKAWRSTPKFKKHNRKYQKKYYKDFLSVEAAKRKGTGAR